MIDLYELVTRDFGDFLSEVEMVAEEHNTIAFLDEGDILYDGRDEFQFNESDLWTFWSEYYDVKPEPSTTLSAWERNI